MIYFYDENKRYIGCRIGEDSPPNSTTTPITLIDGQEAYFLNGAWVVSNIPVTEVVATEQSPTTEEVLTDLIQVLVDKGVIY